MKPERKLGIIQFKRLSAAEQSKLLVSIESAMTYSIRRGVTVTDLEDEASEKLGLSTAVIKIVSGSRKFKTKLQSRML